MIERTYPGRAPQNPPTNEQRWEARRELYRAFRPKEADEVIDYFVDWSRPPKPENKQ